MYNFRRCLRYGDSNNRVVRNRFYTPVLHCKIQRCNSRYLCNSRCFRRKDIKPKPSKVICTLLCVVNIGCLVATGLFEYNPSMTNFRERFSSQQSESDTFVYCDSAFGIMSYYYPKNTHLCTYKENWFEAFENVECINKNEIADKVDPNHKIWFVKMNSQKCQNALKVISSTKRLILSNVTSINLTYIYLF